MERSVGERTQSGDSKTPEIRCRSQGGKRRGNTIKGESEPVPETDPSGSKEKNGEEAEVRNRSMGKEETALTLSQR